MKFSKNVNNKTHAPKIIFFSDKVLFTTQLSYHLMWKLLKNHKMVSIKKVP